MQPKLHAWRIIFLFLFFSCTTILALGQEPSVYTDRKDYSPGDTVLIQGDGWPVGERVELNIEHSKVSYGYYTFYATADADGHFYNKEMVMQPFHKAENFILTATGLGSGALAQTEFTDGTFNSRISGDWRSMETWTVSRTGTIRADNASVIIEGNGTKFLSELSIGDILTTANDASVLGKVRSIESDLLLILETNAMQGSGESAISYAARKVPGPEDNVVINNHTVTLTQNASCLSLNLKTFATLTVEKSASLSVREDMIIQNLSDGGTTARISGSGTINARNLIVGNNSNIIRAAEYTHRLTSTISYLNVLENITINSFMGAYNTRLSHGQLYINTGIVTIGGCIYTKNGCDKNISTFSIALDPGNARLLLYGSPDPFKLDNQGNSTVNLNGPESIVEYVGNGNQNVYRGSQYKYLILGGSGIKNISSVYINRKLTMQGAATAIASTPPSYTATAELEYNGTVAQVTGPEFTASIPKLTINNPLGITITSDKMVTTLLTLKNGVLYTGVFNLRLFGLGSIVEASDKSYVDGRLDMACGTTGIKVFPIGKGGIYRPVRLELTSLVGTGSVMVEQLEEPLTGTLPTNITLFSNRYWKITKAGTASLTYNLTLDGTDMNRNDNAVVLLRSGIIVVHDAVVNGNEYTVKGLSSFGDFGLGYKRLSVATTASVTDAVAIYGNASVDLLATVRGEDGTLPEGGTVTFSIRNYPVEGTNTLLGIAPVGPGGRAALSCNPSALNASSYLIVAHYSGYGLYEASSSDQSIPVSNGELLVSARPITVTADAKSKIYGENDPELTYKVTYGSLVGEDNFMGKLVREAGESAGAYTIQSGNLSLNSNYALSFIEAELVIGKRPITVKAEAKRKVYGDGDPTLTYEVTDGDLVGGDAFQGTLSRAEGENVGSYLIDQGTFTAGDNYELTFIKSSLTITPAPATIHVTDLNRTYDGTAQGVTVRTSPDGLAVAVTYDGDVSIPVNAGSYAVAAVLVNSNYKLVDEQGANLLQQTGILVIGTRPLTIAVNNKSKVYGTSNPALDGNESGLVSSDGISVSYGTTAQTNSDVGEYPINASLVDPDNKLGNYSVIKTEGKLTITPAPATIWVTGLSKTYNGQPQPASVTTLPEGLSVNITYAGSVNVPTNAGSYAVMAVLDNNNYSATNGSYTMVIDKADAVFHIEGYTGEYDGNAHQASGTATGVMGENLSNLLTFGAGVTNVPGGDASWFFMGNENYKAASGTETIVLSKAAPKVTAYGDGFMYDGTPHPGSGAANGVKNEDLVPGVSISYAGTLNNGTAYSSTDAPTEAGIYIVTASFAGNNNYKIGTASAPLRIYAVPIVSLTSPQPVEINTPAIATLNIQGEVFNAQWNYPVGTTCTANPILNEVPDGDKVKLIDGQLTVISPAVGVYTITLSYENGVGARFITTIPAYAVFYDPSAGFVTGGGWIHSPAGAYSADKALTGKATFGFVSKYEKGKTVPSGNTEFQFHTAKMSFRSTAYEYLVVAGSRAQYKGTGTINGTGNYGFMLTGVDGEKDAPGKPDLFRIRIWDKNAGDYIVYDNESGAADDAAISTELGGGSIVIHIPPAGGKKTNTVSAEARAVEVVDPSAKEFSLSAFPNPTISSFGVQVKSDRTEVKISLRVADLNGRTVEVIHNASPGQTYRIGANYRPGIYLVEMIQGSRRTQAMLLKVTE